MRRENEERLPCRKRGLSKMVGRKTRMGIWRISTYFVLLRCSITSRRRSQGPCGSDADGAYSAKKIALTVEASKTATPERKQTKASATSPLLLSEISNMRPKEIKRQLARKYGYSAETLARMIDKKDLIESLAFEQHKEQETKSKKEKKENVRKTIIVALGVIVFFTFWPLIRRVIEILHVNFVVYTDKRKYEVARCLELKSFSAAGGVICMSIIDGLSLWLTVSVGMSWFISRNQYFFPIPYIPIRPAALLATASGGAAGGGPLSHYGINAGPMVVTWLMRYTLGQIEKFTGKRLAAAKLHKEKNAKEQRKAARREAREMMSEEDRAARKELKRREKEEAAIRAKSEACRMQVDDDADATEERKEDIPDFSWNGDGLHPSAEQETNVTTPSREEVRTSTAGAAESRMNECREYEPENMDDLD